MTWSENLPKITVYIRKKMLYTVKVLCSYKVLVF